MFDIIPFQYKYEYFSLAIQISSSLKQSLSVRLEISSLGVMLGQKKMGWRAREAT